MTRLGAAAGGLSTGPVNRRIAGPVAAGTLVLGLTGYLGWVGLERADKVGSCVAAVAAVLALCAGWRPARRSAGVATVTVGGDNAGEISAGYAGPAPSSGDGPATSGGHGVATVAVDGTNTAAIRTRVDLWP